MTILSGGGGDELCEHTLVFDFIRRRVKKKRGTILSHISFRKTLKFGPAQACYATTLTAKAKKWQTMLIGVEHVEERRAKK